MNGKITEIELVEDENMNKKKLLTISVDRKCKTKLGECLIEILEEK